MQVTLFKPSSCLTPYINSYAFAEGILYNHSFRPLSNGMPELIFYFSGPPDLYVLPKNLIKKYKYFVGGQMSDQKFLVNINTRVLNCMSVSFTYTGFYRLFGIPQVEIRDAAMPVELLFGRDTTMITEKLESAEDNFRRIKILESCFIKKIAAQKKGIPNPVTEAISRICDHKGKIKIQSLIRNASLSERAFERNFKYYIGLTCKEFTETIRFGNIHFHLSNLKKSKNWYDLIEDLGYFDQSHFIKDLKRYTGLSPSEFLKKYDEYSYFNRIYLSQERDRKGYQT